MADPLRPRLWEPDRERESPEARWERLRTALQAAVCRLQAHPLHGPRLAGLDPARLREPADLQLLPFTTKAQLHGPGVLDDLAVPRHRFARVHASSGTTGTRTLVAYTAADFQLWIGLVARGLAAVGVTEHSVCYSMLRNGLFTGGLGFHQAAEAIGAATVPAGPGGSTAHLRLLDRLRPDVLFATPSYALHLSQLPGFKTTVALGVFGAEPWSEDVRQALEQRWSMVARDTYGLGEVIGPGVAFECGLGAGMHVNADAIWPEVVDPSTGAPLPPGQEGELVLTVPSKQALPLLRYRTGDRSRLLSGPCPCGRTLPRMARVVERIDDMRVVRGVNVYASQVAAVVGARAFVLELRRTEALAALCVVVERASGEQSLPAGLRRRLQEALGLRLELREAEPGALGHEGGKARRWRAPR
jgi:phenylacetate-CoA ligase